MDKIREEFDGVNSLYNDGWLAGQKSRDEENKKLKDLTEDLLLTLVKYGIKQSEDVIEALKGIT